jgi:hypothetical protein
MRGPRWIRANRTILDITNIESSRNDPECMQNELNSFQKIISNL